jgi:hypothetical protein
VAPELAFHVRATCAFPGAADTPVGIAGAVVCPPPPGCDPPPAVPAQLEYRRIVQIRSERRTGGNKRIREKAEIRASIEVGYGDAKWETSWPKGQKKFSLAGHSFRTPSPPVSLKSVDYYGFSNIA